MSRKRIILSVTASAAIASMIFGANETEAATYKVKSGDSLWSIAQKHQITVAQLKNINKLTSEVIFPNQVLMVGSDNTPSVTPNSTQSNSKQTVSERSITYIVKKGDTLSAIAFQYKISVNDIMKWNGLTSTLIFPGDKLVIKTSSSSSELPEQPNTNKNEVNEKFQTYVVQSGDSLWKIGQKFGVSIEQLKKWNQLSSDSIFIGQKLTIGELSNSTEISVPENNKPNGNSNIATDISYNVEKLIQVAKDLIGSPYVLGGNNPSGFDCSGFIYYAYKQAGMNINRNSSEGYFNRSYYIIKPEVGDLVFFENTYKPGISHVGIYIGNNQFINASSKGVEIASLDNPYWKNHFDSFKRFY